MGEGTRFHRGMDTLWYLNSLKHARRRSLPH